MVEETNEVRSKNILLQAENNKGKNDNDHNRCNILSKDVEIEMENEEDTAQIMIKKKN